MIDGPSREAALFALETTRIGGMLMTAPLPWSLAPVRIRAGFAMLIAFLVHAAGAPSRVTSPWQLAAAVPFELLTGVAMGVVVRLAILPVEVAGETIAPMMGIGTASLFDHHMMQPETALTRLLRLGAVLIALAAGLHRIAIGSVIASFRVLPVASVTNPSLSVPALVRMTGDSLAQGVQFAMPVLAVLVLIQVALAFVSRAAPAMQIFSIGFAVTLVVGSITLVLGLPDFGRSVLEAIGRVERSIEIVVAALTGA